MLMGDGMTITLTTSLAVRKCNFWVFSELFREGGLYLDYTELWVFPASKPRIWIEWGSGWGTTVSLHYIFISFSFAFFQNTFVFSGSAVKILSWALAQSLLACSQGKSHETSVAKCSLIRMITIRLQTQPHLLLTYCCEANTLFNVCFPPGEGVLGMMCVFMAEASLLWLKNSATSTHFLYV